MSDSSGESHTYKKSLYGNNSSVNIDASADSIDGLKLMLQKVGITLPSGGPEAQDDEMPLDAIVVAKPEEEPHGMQFPKTEINPDAQQDPSMTTDKAVLTSIIRDRLKDYLMNSSK